MPAWRSFRFARNLGWNILGQVVSAALSFFLLPYLIGHMGLETYALYILLFTVVNYLSLFSFGAGSAAVKYVAAYCAAGNGPGLKNALRHAVGIGAFGAFLGIALLVLAAPYLAAHLFHVPGTQLGLAIFVLRCAAAAALFVALTQIALSIMQGLQRFDCHNLIIFLQTGLLPIGAAGVLTAGGGIKGVVCWYVALNVCVCFIAAALAWRLLRPTLALPGTPGVGFRPFLFWGMSQWVGTIPGLILGQSDRIVIASDGSRGDSLAALTLYSVPAGFIQRLQIIPTIIASVITPMMIELHEHKDEESLKRVYLRSVRFVFWAGLPVLALLFALMPQFLTLWLGVQFSDNSVWPMRFLILMQVLSLLVAMPTTVAFSRDKPWKYTQMAWTHTLMTFVAWRLLVPRLHLLGIALGALLAQIVPTYVLVSFVHRRLIKVGAREFLKEGLAAPAMSAALILALVFPLHALATSWTKLLGLFLLGYAAYYASTWVLLNRQDRDTVLNYLRWER